MSSPLPLPISDTVHPFGAWRRRLVVSLVVGLFGLGVYLGLKWQHPAVAQARQAWLMGNPVYRWWALEQARWNGLVRTDAPAVACPAQYKAIAVFGQSNSANAISRPAGLKSVHDGKTFMWDWSTGQCHAYAEPLVGTDGGQRGNIMTAVVAALRQVDAQSNLIIVAFGRGGSNVFGWSHGRESVRLDKVIDALQARGIQPGWFLWHQGESDAVPDTYLPAKQMAYGDAEGAALDFYARALERVLMTLHGAFPKAQVGVALASVCRNRGSQEIRDAQRLVDARHDWVHISSDTDALGPSFRHDGCHFNEAGEARIAQDYARLLLSSK